MQSMVTLDCKYAVSSRLLCIRKQKQKMLRNVVYLPQEPSWLLTVFPSELKLFQAQLQLTSP